MINLKQAIMKKSIFLLLCISVLFSCTKKEDFFDPHHIDEEAKENFPVENIDPNHNWEMAGVGNMTVSIKDGTGETYKIQVCTDNPLNIDNSARLLSEQTIKDGESKSFSFDMPLAQDYLFVVKESADYSRVVIPTVLENGKFTVNIGSGTRSLRGFSDAQPKALSINYSLSNDAFNCPDNAKQISPAKDVWEIMTLTVTGNCFIDSPMTCERITMEPNSHLYIKAGGSLTVEVSKGNSKQIYYYNDFLALKSTESISILAGGSLICKTHRGIDLSGGNLYNQGELKVINGKIDNYAPTSGIIMSSGSVYNEGSIDVKKEDISISGGQFINAAGGKISTMDNDLDLKVTSKGEFHNQEDAFVAVDDTEISGGVWLNEGEYKTTEMDITGSSAKIQNNCKLLVGIDHQGDGEFELNSSVTFENSGYVECKEAEWGQGRILMTSGAIFKVSGKAEYYSNFTIEGPTTGKDAYLIMEQAKYKESSGSNNEYKGNLTIVCDNYFSNSKADLPLPINKPIAGSNSIKIELPTTECSDGHHQEVVPPTPVARQVYTYVFEDMTREAGDFDFNDVVLKVTVPDESGKATVALFAAGATKNLWVGYKNNDLFGEVHTAMGCEPGTLINTGSGPNVAPVEKEITIAGTLIQNGDFYIYDENKIEIHIASMVSPESTYPPYGLCIPGDWEFPKERNKITGLYRYFENWVQDYIVCTRWYEEHMQEFKSAWDAANGEYPYADK